MIPFAPGFFKFQPVGGLEPTDKPMLVSLFLGGTTAALAWNKDDPSNPRKAQYDAAPPDLFYHLDTIFGSSLSYVNAGPIVSDTYFDIKATYSIFAGNTSWSGDYTDIDIEFLNSTDTVRAALRIRKNATYKNLLSYGPNLSNLTSCQQSADSAAYVEGLVSFTPTQLIFTNTRSAYYNTSFILGGLDLSDVVKFRYSNVNMFAGSISAISSAPIQLFLDSVAGSTPSAVPYTKSLLNLNGTHGSTTITDEISGHTWTAYNGASISTTQSKFGGASVNFDGVNDYIRVANHADFATAGNEMVWQAWVWMDPATPTYGRLAETSAYNSAIGGWLVYKDPTGKIAWQLAKSGGGGSSITSDVAMPTNQWVHLAVVRKANVGYIYVNGVRQAATLTLSSENWTSQTLVIGNDLSVANPFKGYVDDSRLDVGNVSAYPSALTIPSSAFTFSTESILMHFNGSHGSTSFPDDSGKSWTRFGDTIISTTQSYFGGASAYFDGTGDYLSTSTVADLQFGTGDYTIECFVYMPSVTGTKRLFQIGKYVTAGQGAVWYIENGLLTIYQGNVKYQATLGAVAINTWTHVAWCRKNGVTRFFKNGVPVYAFADTANHAPTNPTYLGCDPDGGGAGIPGNFYIGYVDELRVKKGVADYAEFFTPPTAQLTAI